MGAPPFSDQPSKAKEAERRQEQGKARGQGDLAYRARITIMARISVMVDAGDFRFRPAMAVSDDDGLAFGLAFGMAFRLAPGVREGEGFGPGPGIRVAFGILARALRMLIIGAAVVPGTGTGSRDCRHQGMRPHRRDDRGQSEDHEKPGLAPVSGFSGRGAVHGRTGLNIGKHSANGVIWLPETYQRGFEGSPMRSD